MELESVGHADAPTCLQGLGTSHGPGTAATRSAQPRFCLREGPAVDVPWAAVWCRRALEPGVQPRAWLSLGALTNPCVKDSTLVYSPIINVPGQCKRHINYETKEITAHCSSTAQARRSAALFSSIFQGKKTQRVLGQTKVLSSFPR